MTPAIESSRIIVKKNISQRTVHFLGWLCVFASAFFFYIATTVIKWSIPHVVLDSSLFVFTRLLLGFFVIFTILIIKKKPVKAKRYHLLIGRTMANLVAVYCFYKAVIVTSVAEANILNMTYPLFIAIFTWVVLKKERDMISVAIVMAALTGVWMILAPGKMDLAINHIWGLLSGISASAAIIYLNESRKYHDTDTILFYMFGLGTIIIYFLFRNNIFIPGKTGLFYLFSSASLGICGQYLLTIGFRYVTAVEGAVISSSRILMAAVLSPFLVGDPPLTFYGWAGAILIFGANLRLAFRK